MASRIEQNSIPPPVMLAKGVRKFSSAPSTS
jgi:hypothetical protein